MRITTTHDVFRSSVFQLPDLESSIGPWLFAWLSPHLSRLGHKVQRFSLPAGTGLLAAAEQGGWPRDHTGWTWLFSDPRARQDVADLIAPLRKADLVIGFEMTPNMLHALTAAGVRLLDITQDAVRFCPDLFLRIRSNDPTLAGRIARWEIPEPPLRTAASLLRSQIGHRYEGPRAVLFCGQVPVDSTLIAGARLARIDPFPKQIAECLAGRALLLKPHPHAPKSTDLLTLYRHFPAARFIADNIYALLADPAIEQVVTLSSSVATEAPLFGKPALQLITPDIHALPEDVVSRFYRVDARINSTAFWGDVLDGMPNFMFHETPPPPLRRSFSASWGYGRDMLEPVSRRVETDATVRFAVGSRGPALCLFGWSDPEPWGIWSDGPYAMLQFTPD